MPAMDVVDCKVYGDDMQYVEVELDPGAGKRLLMGESMFMTVFMNQASGKRKVAFAAPYTGCIVAFQPTVNYDIQYIGKVKTAHFGGEGLFFATLRGPGRVWPGLTGRSREEGSILGNLGGILNGE